MVKIIQLSLVEISRQRYLWHDYEHSTFIFLFYSFCHFRRTVVFSALRNESRPCTMEKIIQLFTCWQCYFRHDSTNATFSLLILLLFATIGWGGFSVPRKWNERQALYYVEMCSTFHLSTTIFSTLHWIFNCSCFLLIFATLGWGWLSVPRNEIKGKPSSMVKSWNFWIVSNLSTRLFSTSFWIFNFSGFYFYSSLQLSTADGFQCSPPKWNDRHTLFCCKNHSFFHLWAVCREL